MVTKLMNWFDDRLPLTATIERHLTKYPAPINMNIWYPSRGTSCCSACNTTCIWYLALNEL